MDGRLHEAALVGDVDYLLNLINNEPLILIKGVALAGGESPLHIASIAGHLDFLKEVLKFRKDFAAQLNQDGLSPLHLASAIGYTEIVKELLKVDQNLCLLKGKESRIPLHYASINGKIDAIKELLSASADSIKESTARGETALHLAVKNHQFEAFKVLLDHIEKFKKKDALNKRDCQGNTILHLAVVNKQYEVIDFVFNGNVLIEGAIEVNSLDERGLTPLDVLLLVQNETGDREIEKILRQAGAIRARDLQNQPAPTNDSPVNDVQPSSENNRSPSKKLQEYFRYKRGRESPSEVRNCLLVIAVLIATATYQAVLSPPGGVWQDDSTIRPKHTAGKSVLGTQILFSYSLFLVFNSIGFYASIYMINFLTLGFPLRFELQVSLVALIATYITSMEAITPGKINSIIFTLILTFMPFGLYIGNKVRRDWPRVPEFELGYIFRVSFIIREPEVPRNNRV